jgi:hypothetical protein
MRHLSRLSRIALSFALAGVLAAGAQSFVPAAFACGTNAGGGNCKQAAPRKPSLPDGWTIVTTVLTGLRYTIWL